MIEFSVTHHEGYVSRTEVATDDSDLVTHAVVVYTPAAVRRGIMDKLIEVNELIMQNCDRALSDGTRQMFDGEPHIGGLPASSPLELQKSFDLAVAVRDHHRIRKEELRDLYQVVGWAQGETEAMEILNREKPAVVSTGRQVYRQRVDTRVV